MNDFKIKPELLKEWRECVANNSNDSYSFGVMVVVCKSFDVLDAGGTPKEAEEAWKGCDLTGFMAGCAANIISRFHERGDEFRTYWNGKFGVKSATGTVQPAIMELAES